MNACYTHKVSSGHRALQCSWGNPQPAKRYAVPCCGTYAENTEQPAATPLAHSRSCHDSLHQPRGCAHRHRTTTLSMGQYFSAPPMGQYCRRSVGELGVCCVQCSSSSLSLDAQHADHPALEPRCKTARPADTVRPIYETIMTLRERFPHPNGSGKKQNPLRLPATHTLTRHPHPHPHARHRGQVYEGRPHSALKHSCLCVLSVELPRYRGDSSKTQHLRMAGVTAQVRGNASWAARCDMVTEMGCPA